MRGATHGERDKARAELAHVRDFTIGVLRSRKLIGLQQNGLMAAADERAQQPPPQLVGDLALVERLRLEPDADGRGAVGERLDADDLDRRQDQRRPTPRSRSIAAPTSRIVPITRSMFSL